MIDSDVVIVGGGPAGSACAQELRKGGISVIILDKQSFPRHKVCAGWITPRVFATLGADYHDYPYGILTLKRIDIHVCGLRIPVPTQQYSIRRYEFDNWLVQRTGVPLYKHTVRNVWKEMGSYIIDDGFRTSYLVGAGGTHCPVYRTFFEDHIPRVRTRLITTLEDEFRYTERDPQCRLWYFERGLPGYAWYVPKPDGFVNIGIGAKFLSLKQQNTTIHRHWEYFVRKLANHALVPRHSGKPRGYNYYLRQPMTHGWRNNAFVVGDAAGMATVDMGEGIGPAVASGIMAARAIISGKSYSPRSIGRYSLPGIVFPWFR